MGRRLLPLPGLVFADGLGLAVATTSLVVHIVRLVLDVVADVAGVAAQLVGFLLRLALQLFRLVAGQLALQLVELPLDLVLQIAPPGEYGSHSVTHRLRQRLFPERLCALELSLPNHAQPIPRRRTLQTGRDPATGDRPASRGRA